MLIRAAEPLDNGKADLSGPGKLTRALKITRSENGMNLTGDRLFLLGDPDYRPRIKRAARIGVDYAKEWKDALLRFYDAKSPAVRHLRSTRFARSLSVPIKQTDNWQLATINNQQL